MSENMPLSSYARKQQMLKGKKVLFNSIPISQVKKCLLLNEKDTETIHEIATGKDLNYSTIDKPGWQNGNLIDIFAYERYLSNGAI